MNSPQNREDWLKARVNGIGASEAAAIVGMSPYKTNVELWEEKTGRRKQADISGKSYVQYGNDAEGHLRELFALDFTQYKVGYDQFGMIRNNPDCPFAFATLDGDLTDEKNRRGVFEVKTTEIMRAGQWAEWKDKVPQHYYIQLMHQLLATMYDFSVLKAQIKAWRDGELSIYIRHYFIERVDVQGDIDWLAEREKVFWNCVQNDIKPALILPEI